MLGGRTTLNCPNCDKLVQIDDLLDVPVNFALLSFAEKQPEVPKLQGLLCRFHAKKAKFYCVSCSLYFCTPCFEGHKTHQIHSLATYLGRRIDTLLIKVFEQQALLDKRLLETQGFMSSAQAEWAKAKADLEERFAEVGSSVGSEVAAMQDELEAIKAQNAQTEAEFTTLIQQRAEFLQSSLRLLRQFKQLGCTAENIDTIDNIEAQLGSELQENVSLRRVKFKAEEPIGRIVSQLVSSLLAPLQSTDEESKEVPAQVRPKSSKVKAKSNKKTAYWWQENKTGHLTPFGPGDSRLIEKSYQSQVAGFILRRSVVDFEKMTILNEINGECRRICREVS
jgi:hypothetical protein